jgi:hypothetical protein
MFLLILYGLSYSVIPAGCKPESSLFKDSGTLFLQDDIWIPHQVRNDNIFLVYDTTAEETDLKKKFLKNLC